jgi:hypothetical protein
MGYCSGYAAPGYANPGPGLGYGRGMGRGGGFGGGRGRRNMYWATGLPGWARAGYAPAGGTWPPAAEPAAEAEMLKAQATQFERALEEIKARLAELEAESKKEK